MEIKILHFDSDNELYHACLQIREKVLRQPIGLKILPKDLEKDPASTHILAMVGGKPAGTVALLLPSLREGQGEGAAYLRQMAILDDFQGLGLGRKLLEYLENLAHKNGVAEIHLEARDYAIPFYSRCAYATYGEMFMKPELGILHQWMKKKL